MIPEMNDKMVAPRVLHVTRIQLIRLVGGIQDWDVNLSFGNLLKEKARKGQKKFV